MVKIFKKTNLGTRCTHLGLPVTFEQSDFSSIQPVCSRQTFVTFLTLVFSVQNLPVFHEVTYPDDEG